MVMRDRTRIVLRCMRCGERFAMPPTPQLRSSWTKNSLISSSLASVALSAGSVGELIDELRFLFISFPHLSDAFDADGLPLPFIIKRDARVKTSRRHTSAPSAAMTTVSRHARRGGGTMRHRGE